MFALSPLTAKRLKSFRRNRRAVFSLWALIAIFAVSLVSELICNSRPLWIRWRGSWHFPFLDSSITYAGLGLDEKGDEPVDFKEFTQSPEWKSDPGAKALWAPFRHSPYEVASPSDLSYASTVRVTVEPDRRIGRCDILPDGRIMRQEGMALSANGRSGFLPEGAETLDAMNPPPAFKAALADAFAGRLPKDGAPVRGVLADGSAWTARVRNVPGGAGCATVLFRQEVRPAEPFNLEFRLEDGEPVCKECEEWDGLPPASRKALAGLAKRHFDAAMAHKAADPAPVAVDTANGGTALASAVFKYATFPFPPCDGHPFGLDSGGRDVLALVLYGTRIALSFGLILAFSGMFIGLAVGAVEGYFGGKVDIAGQRATEIWSAIPFLYVMIFIGATIGRSFTVLLACYALFNWILVSYYVRAEFLRLRSRTFVEAARCQGLSHARIIFGHILPNALTPLVTLFPFLLMGAVGSLSILDFLGFGLPAFTPSWGDLVSQGQQFRWAWWLILFPSVALFAVMLLTVLVGEGLRDAFDPRQKSKLE